MSAATIQDETRATGRDVVLAIGETMVKGLEPLLSKTLAPSLYLVYLHPRDFDRLRGVFSRLEEEARQHLQQELERLARRAVPARNKLLTQVGHKLPSWLKPDPSPTMSYEPAEGGFYVRFEEDPDGELAPGDVKVTADLAVGEAAGYSGGNPTHRISTTRRLGQSAGSSPEVAQVVMETAPTLATFRFTDDRGQRSYAMVSEEIVLGRRAPDRWVDLHLETAFDVSREHARVRHRAGRFEIKDLSMLGTVVNGQVVPPSLETVDGKTKDADRWFELQDVATLDLAGKIRLAFKKGAA